MDYLPLARGSILRKSLFDMMIENWCKEPQKGIKYSPHKSFRKGPCLEKLLRILINYVSC